jgi:hypothetical protein
VAITVRATSKRRGSSGVQAQVRKPNPVQARVPMAIRRARPSDMTAPKVEAQTASPSGV